jgi:hypothetical protein
MTRTRQITFPLVPLLLALAVSQAYGANCSSTSSGSPGSGDGATSTCTAQASGAGSVVSQASASGGSGASTNLPGQVSGHGGGATVSAYGQSASGSVTVSATGTGGHGGHSYLGKSGNGAVVTLDNAVSGQTSGALSLTQVAIGGHGGNVVVDDPGYLGDGPGYGGSAGSRLTLSDAAASSLSATIAARGGNAGAVMYAGDVIAAYPGGDGNASLSLSSSRAGTAVSGSAESAGGIGGYASTLVTLTGQAMVSGGTTATGGNGYPAGAAGVATDAGWADATMVLTGSGAVHGTVSAVGGNGGAGIGAGTGGYGAGANASLSLVGAGATGGGYARGGSGNPRSGALAVSVVHAVTTGALSVNLTNTAVGGDGGSASAITGVQSGGGAGDLHASVKGTANAYGGKGHKLDASATLTLAGSGAILGSAYAAGGNGFGDANGIGGGDGGDAIVNVSGITSGNYDVNLAATAIAGSSSPFGRAGGTGVSIYGKSGSGAVTLAGTAIGGSDDLGGGAAYLTNAVSGLTSGHLSLSQTAIGGDNLFAPPYQDYSGGGEGNSSLTVNNATASQLTGVTVARGGAGGSGLGMGGYAFSVTDLTSTVAGAVVNGSASAYGGISRYVSPGGANANSQVDALGTAQSASLAAAQSYTVSQSSARSKLSANAMADAVSNLYDGSGYAEALASARTSQAGLSHASANAVGDQVQSTASAFGVGKGRSVAIASGQGVSGMVAADSTARSSFSGSQVHGSALVTLGDESSVNRSSATSYSAANHGGATYGLPALDGSVQALSNVNGAPGASESAALLAAGPNVAATLTGPLFGSGVQAASYALDGAPGHVFTYVMSGQFQFEMTAGHVLVGFLGASALNTGFDLLELSIRNDNVSLFSHSFTSLAEANLFFTDNVVDLGLFNAGLRDVVITSSLTASSANGYAFSYALGTDVAAAVPEASSWLLLAMGLTVVLLVARRRRAGAAPIALSTATVAPAAGRHAVAGAVGARKMRGMGEAVL